MSGIFVDTSGWGNLVDLHEPFHSLTVEIYRSSVSQKRRIVTTNYILTEFVALTTSPFRISRPAVIEFIQSLKDSPYVEVVHIDQNLDEQAWSLLKRRKDKEWSHVDCSSFVVMKQRGITEALTNDRHFEQFGVIRLLK